MSEITSERITTSQRRSWIRTSANGLVAALKASFVHMSNAESDALILANRLEKEEKGSVYLRAILTELARIPHDPNAPDVKNRQIMANIWWNQLMTVEESMRYARILTPDDLPEVISVPSNITSVSDYIEIREENDLLADLPPTVYDSAIVAQGVNRFSGAFSTVASVMSELTSYAVGFGSFIGFNQFRQAGLQAYDNRMIKEQSVPCVLSGLPLRHVKEIEVARSGKILKFRATGSVFLANQEGGEDAIRIEGILVRSEIVLILALWGIFYYGQGRLNEAQIDKDEISLKALRSKNVDVTSYNKTTEKPAYTHHYTVPFVSRHIIIPNTYIETLSFEEKVIFGKDVIGYSILLRTYRKPSGFDLYCDNEKEYVAPKGNSKMYKIVEFAANMAWRLYNSQGLVIDEREWKIGGDKALSDDVYYDFNPLDLVDSVTLGMFGLK